RPAFTEKEKASLLAAIMCSKPAPVSADRGASPALGPAFDRLVQRCLEKDPDDRWQSARDLASELDWIASGAPIAKVSADDSAGSRRGVAARAVAGPARSCPVGFA